MWSLLCSVYEISEVGAMIIKNLLKKTLLVVGLLSMSLGFIFPNAIYAEERVEVVEVTFEYGWSYKETENEYKQAALDGAKRRAIEMVCTFINSYCEEADFKLIKDKVISMVMGEVSLRHEPQFEIDKEKRICKVTIDARVKYDEDAIRNSIDGGCSCRPQVYKERAVAFAGKDKRVHYYQIIDRGLDWHDAKKACEDAGGHLVTIGSKEEQKFIEELLRKQGNRNCYWLGGEKVGKKLFWIDNTPFTYTNWAKWQPDNPQEKVLMIYKNTNPRAPLHVLGTWADLRSDGTFPNEGDFFSLDHFGFICEWDS